MLLHPTLEKLSALRLTGMAAALEDLGFRSKFWTSAQSLVQWGIARTGIFRVCLHVCSSFFDVLDAKNLVRSVNCQ